MTTITTIDLLCHGEIEGGDTFCGSTDHSVSDLGWMQMEEALGFDTQWDIVVSSPLERCAEFAESIAESIGELILDDNFKEIHYGKWEGKPPDNIMQESSALLKAWWQSPTQITPPEGEEFYDFHARVLKAWKELITEFQGNHVLLVTHSGVIRIILMHILGMPLDNLFRMEVGYGCHSRVIVRSDQNGQWVSLVKHG